MSKVHECSFECDREGCTNRSAPEENWTDARKSAEAAGWFIRPDSHQPTHVCSACVEAVLINGKEKAKKGADQEVPAEA